MQGNYSVNLSIPQAGVQVQLYWPQNVYESICVRKCIKNVKYRGETNYSK